MHGEPGAAPAARWPVLHEPTTLVLDYVTALLCGWFAAKLWLLPDAGSAVPWWAAMFACLALAAITGGTKHGFFAAVDTRYRRAVWVATFYLGGLSASLMLAAVAVVHVPEPTRGWLAVAMTLEFCLFLGWARRGRDYHWVMVRYAPLLGMALLMLLLLPPVGGYANMPAAQLARYRTWVVVGCSILVVAGVVQARRVVLHRHFNHNDLAHLVILAGLWALWRGAASVAAPARVLATLLD